jgi:hypothetical protein
MRTVVVEPLPLGWRVQTSANLSDQYFLSGKAAELAARQLAARLASAGLTVELTLRLRGGALGAKFICLPPARAGEPPLTIETPGGRGLVAQSDRDPVPA